MTTENDTARLVPQAQHELTGELAQLVLEQIAPEELVLFEETAEEYFRHPEAVLNPQHRDEPVGFGLDLALLTPYVLAVAMPVVQWLAATVAEAVGKESKPLIGSLVRYLFRRDGETSPDETAPVPPLSIEQARRVREIAYQQAKALGLDDDQTALLADSVVGAVLVAE